MPRVLTWLWGLLFVLIVTAGALRLPSATVHTDIRALLPAAGESAWAERILAHSTERSREVWILVGAQDTDTAAQAAHLFAQTARQVGLSVQSPAEQFDLKALAQSLAPYRDSLLTDEDRAFLTEASDKALLHRALSRLYRPVSVSPLPFEDDPLGTFENALTAQAAASPFDFTGPCVSLKAPLEGRHWCALTARPAEAMSAVGSTPVTQAIDKARKAMQARFADARVVASGVPLISEEAAEAASSEATLIGAVSTVGIVVLVLAFFASLTPLVLTLTVLAASLVFAAATVLLVFDQVHVLTLVFGATLLGICVDYVFHVLCATATGLTGGEARQALLKPLTLSLITTAVGYGVMAASPMPGLRQMALFCLAGLTAAYFNMLFVVPRFLKATSPKPFARAFARAFAALPTLKGRARPLFVLALLAVAAAGSLQLTAQNELQLLNRLSPAQLEQMRFVGKALSPESAGQLFVVTGETPDVVRGRAKALRERLAALTAAGLIGRGPDPTALLAEGAVQAQNRSLTFAARQRALQLTSQTLGMDFPAASEAVNAPLTPQVLRRALPAALDRFWLSDQALLVPLAGVTPASLSSLKALEKELEGVRFVNTTAEVAESLAHYRDGVFTALLITMGLIALLLTVALRGGAWARWLPTFVSVALTLGVLGWLGIAFSLFTVLPLVLVVGLGADYAIVLYGEKDATAAGNSVFLAASSTLLAFGLLAFSSTPALHAFGLTLSIAMAAVLVTTVLLRPQRM